MPRLTIDDRVVDVDAGSTVLEAARRLGIEIPTLCHREGCRPSTSCLVCLVKVVDTGRVSPACGTPAVEGMRIESETDEVRGLRRSALELLLSDHLGDCLAPCYFACPAEMDIPQMLRQIVAGDMRGAIETIKRDIALPAVLGRICPAPCEKVCRRAVADGAVAICLLKRYVADADLASSSPYVPPQAAPSGKRAAVVGGGPTGISAAYCLARQGHEVMLFEAGKELGGRLHRETTAEQLPRDVLRAEIATLVPTGIDVRLDAPVAGREALDALRQQFDAVLLACGAMDAGASAAWGLATTDRGIQVKANTYETSVPGVFAAGCAVRRKAIAVRSVGDGKEAAAAIDQWLAGAPVVGAPQPFSTKIGKMDGGEVGLMLRTAAEAPRRPPADRAAGFSPAEAVQQSARCLHCDCRALSDCKLRRYAAEYGAEPKRYKTQRRAFEQDIQHTDVVFEQGKCIACGLCIEIAAAAKERLGLTFVGRGFDVRVAAPLGHAIGEALEQVAAACIEACPTAALAWKDASALSAPRSGVPLALPVLDSHRRVERSTGGASGTQPNK
jgi:NADPH-dependent glutamate synthase beta subunit-like oxidoreductase/ferredoxin